MSFVRGHRRTRTQAEVNVLEACKVNSSLPSQTFACTTAKPLDLSDKNTNLLPATSCSSVSLPAVPVAQAERKAFPYTLKKLSAKDSSHASSLKEYRFPKLDSPNTIIAPVIIVPTTSTLSVESPSVETPAGQQVVNDCMSMKASVIDELDTEAAEVNQKTADLPYLDTFFRERVTKCMMEVVKNGRTRRLVESIIVELPSPTTTAFIRREYKCREKSSALYLNSGIPKTYQLKLWEPIVSPTLVS